MNLENASLSLEDLQDSLQLAFGILKSLAEKYGDPRARLIFAIST